MSSSTALALCLLSLMPFATAQTGGFKFEADPLTVGNLALWCISGFLFLAQTVACAIALVNARGHRPVFAVLLAADVFSFFACVAATSFVVVANNALGEPAPHVIPALDSLQAFSYNWSLALLYLAMVLAFADREAAMGIRSSGDGEARRLSWAGLGKSSGRLAKAYSLVHYAYFLLLFVLGTAAAGLLTSYENLEYTATEISQLAELNSLFAEYTKVNYVFTAFWCITALDVVGIAAQTFRTMRRTGSSDVATKVLLYAGTPLYFFLILCGLIFTVLFSPAGLKITPSTYSRLESSADADVVLLNVFYFAVAMVLVVLGLRRGSWETRGGASGVAGPHVKLQDWPQGNAKSDRQSYYTMNSDA